MALGKQLCCFGIVLVTLWLGTSAFSGWSLTSGGSSSTVKSKKTQLQPAQRAPQAVPQGNPPPGKTQQRPAVRPQQTSPQQTSPQQTSRQQTSPQQTSPQQTSPLKPDQKTTTPTIDKCRVADHDRVPCGVPGTSAGECQALDCCFDGAQCYFGLTVTLHCTRDAQFIVVVSKDVTLPRLNLDTVSLMGGTGDPTCGPVDSNSAFAIYQFPVTACGTLMKEEDGFVIYENRMTSAYEVGIGPRGSITRDSYYELSVQCRYYGTSVEALLIEVLPVPGPVNVYEAGPLNVELRLGSGKCTAKGCVEETVAYSSYYAAGDYPVTFVLREPVYVEVRLLERTDPNIVLTLGNCWSTFYPESTSMPQWDLLIDGCPYTDDRYQTTLLPISSDVDHVTHYRRFMLKMFMFVEIQQFTSPVQDTVYIHCQATVCKPSAGDSCEPRCSRFKRDVSGLKQGQEEAPETVTVSSGALRFKA